MHLLLTGGLGFIGSHVASLMGNEESIKITIVDNLSNSTQSVYENILEIVRYKENIIFIQGDVLDNSFLNNLFEKNNFDGVIHFASLKAVGESVKHPLMYYQENLNGLLNLLGTMKNYNCTNFLFSSSATVYGSDNPSPLKESDKIGLSISNPYGQTKYFQEQILNDFANVNEEFQITILRYFNPIGAHPSGLIGENPNGIPNNLFPYVLRVATREYPKLTVFGNDYDTVDGTCMRDFIHVMDLADAHFCAIKNSKPGINIYNVGTGEPVSVLQLIQTFEKVNTTSIPYVFSGRRQGDIAVTYADATKIFKELGWKSKYTLEDMCKNGYNFIMKN